jgi:ATP-dependent helicase HepA
MDQPSPGQRWVSDSEPELGIGVVRKAEYGRAEIFFPATHQHRQYALHSAPLRRVRFLAGDTVKTHDGRTLDVLRVEERQKMLFYIGEGVEISEAELSDTISFSKPEDRLMAGQVDEPRVFDLRVEALKRRAEIRQSPVRGFRGGRVDLLPHQMYIASEVAGRLVPRVLLADEVGLGKTIEACLILHRLHLTGRAERVLILVPEPLMHQWFVELFRRFHLLFALFDEERCTSLEANAENGNPFLDSQLVIASTTLLSDSPRRAEQAREAGWDLLIVDEAHHLEWSAESPSPAYQTVESLAEKIPGLLLLTATPQQLGPQGHFARLRLLDPNRYTDLTAFLEETGHYEEVAHAVDRLATGKSLTTADKAIFAKKSPHVRELAATLKEGDAAQREKLIAALLDEFGTGRVMFRNTRAALGGFPERRAHLAPLDASEDDVLAKVRWLAALLKKLGGEKVLLICRSRELVERIHELLAHEIVVNAALFHEGLTLLQRDRHAAYFAEEEGARVLLCSEIGSEGRNFQFAHHLVLFDLPEDPELLEQRIGRLDRIGQVATIHLHVPYIKDSAEEALARWYHEGLNAFGENLHGATKIADSLRKGLESLLGNFDHSTLETFIQESRTLRQGITRRLERGHDRLLELNSCKPQRAETLIRTIREQESGSGFEEFFIRLVDHFGMHVEELGNRGYFLLPGNLTTDAFPALPDEGLSVTFDRSRALSRENMGFLTPDHPMMRGALDLLLGSEEGNSSFVLWRNTGAEGLLLETHFVVECIAPAELHVDRFLSPSPIRVVVDHAGKDRREDEAYASAKFEKGVPTRLLENASVKRKLFPSMLSKSRKHAESAMKKLVEEAKTAMQAQMQSEIQRLEDLRQINDHVRPDEITTLRNQMQSLDEALSGARIRLDMLRLVLQTKGKA